MKSTKKTLSNIIEEFMRRYKLSHRETGKILGVSGMTVKIMLTGEDPATGNPINIKPKTLEKIAQGFEKMGYSMTYEDLLIACGYLKPPKREKDPLMLELKQLVLSMDKELRKEFLEEMVLFARVKKERAGRK